MFDAVRASNALGDPRSRATDPINQDCHVGSATMTDRRGELARVTLGVISIAALILGSLWILRPFLGATIWASMIVVASWPALLWLQRRLWGRRALAVALMTSALLLMFVVPLSLAIGTIVMESDRLIGWARGLSQAHMPPAPEFLGGIPVIGPKAVDAWNRVAESGADELISKVAPYANDIIRWFVSEVGGAGFLVVQFLVTVVLAALMYASGEQGAATARLFGRRLAGDRGENAVRLAGQAIRAVALGVGVTAIVQSVLGGIALAIAGVPFAGLLTAVMFMLCIAQLGPILVLLPAIIWTYLNGDVGWGTFLLLCSVVVGTMDNFLRPILIRRGADLPLLLILAGVIGGLLAFGLVGIFVGPVLLAVSYKLLGEWIAEADDLRQRGAEESQHSAP
jgi:predicted PurR-regulated permease PerM